MTVKRKRKPLPQAVKDWLGGSPYGGGLYAARKAEQRRKKVNHHTTEPANAPIGQASAKDAAPAANGERRMLAENFRMSEAHDRTILEALAEDGGFTALAIADRSGLGSGNGRMRSGAMRSWLALLEARGLVRKMDDQKPICWVRTPEGTKALQLDLNSTGEASEVSDDR